MKKLAEFVKLIVNNKVFKNFSYLLLGNVGMQLLNLVAVMIIAKIYKPELFGIYSYMMAQSMLLTVIADLGTKTIIIRSAANNGDDILNKNLSISIICSLITNLLLFFIYQIYNTAFGGLVFIQILLVSFYSIILSYTNNIESVFLGKQKMLPAVITNILTSVIWLFFIAFALKKSLSINLFFLIFILIYSLKPIILSVVLFFKFNFRFSINDFNNEFRKVLGQALPFFGFALIALPANNLANNFLEVNSSIDQVGFFSLSQKFTSPISMILSLMFTSLFPNFSKLWMSNRESFKRIVIKSLPIFILIGTFLVSVFIIVIDPIFKFLFSASYYHVIIIIKLQIWYVFLFGVASLIGTILTAMHEDKLLFKMALLNTVIVAPILWISSKYGGVGLSLGYLSGFIVFLTIEWVIFAKKLKLPRKISYVWLLPIGIFCVYNAIYFYCL